MAHERHMWHRCLQHGDGAEDVVHDIVRQKEDGDGEQRYEEAACCVEHYSRRILAAWLAEPKLKVVT